MNKLIALCLLLVACNTRTTADLQKEYEDVIKERSAVEAGIDLYTMTIEAAEKTRDDEGVVYYTKLVDSLTLRKAALEKRRQELARQLYQ